MNLTNHYCVAKPAHEILNEMNVLSKKISKIKYNQLEILSPILKLLCFTHTLKCIPIFVGVFVCIQKKIHTVYKSKRNKLV